jgi:hypothetical protein
MKGQQNKMSKETLLSGYEDHKVIDWIKELKYFSFYKGSLNPYLTDGDGFDCDLRYVDKEDLLNVLRLLGIRFRLLKDSEPRIIRGESYSQDEFKRLPKTTGEFSDIEEIPNNRINGIQCCVSIPKGYIHISLRKKQHEKEFWLTDLDKFEKANKIEYFILECGLEDRVTKDFQEYKGYVDRQKLELII